MLIGDFIQAFKAGKELANAETWKRRQVLVNSVAALGMAALSIAAAFGYRINLDADGVQAIAAAVAAIVGLFNAGATVATTTRIGLPDRADNGTDATPAGEVEQQPEPIQPDPFESRSIG